MSDTTQAIAGAITGGILDEAVKGGYAVDERTVEALNEAETPPETPQEPPQAADPVDEIVESLKQQGEQETQDVSEDLTPDEDDEFELPDFEGEADAELLNEEIAASGDENYEEQEWVAEPIDNDARRRAIIAEKKAAYYENLTAKRERKKWEAEADKHFPLWRARGEINVNSRRGFLKAAKEADAAVTPFVSAATKTRLEQLEAERAQMKTEVKQEAAEAWGKPTTVQASPDADSRDYAAEISEARRNQDLAKVLSIKREWKAAGGGEENG